jgi:predicted transport protein
VTDARRMQALEVAGKVTVVFTKVMDELSRGVVDEDEEAEAFPADRQVWEEKASKALLAIADDVFQIAKQFDPKLELKYNKHYIGLGRDGAAFNFVQFRPKKSAVNLEIKLPKTADVDAKIEQAGLDTLEYNRWGRNRLRLSANDVKNKTDVLRDLMRLAYERRAA